MDKSNLKSGNKVLLVAFFLIFLSCFYTAFRLNNFNHHCSDPAHCSVCLEFQVLNSEPESPLGSNLSSQFEVFAFTDVYSETFYKDSDLIRSTPVSNRVKKTE